MEDISVLIEKSQAGDKEAKRILVERNMGLVHTIVRRFLGRGYESEDLFQIGCIGLIKAIDKFDLSLGLRFSTYAVPVITGEIKRFLRDDGPIKISRSLKENSWKVSKARVRLLTELKREPAIDEIARECGLSREDVVMAMEAGREVESLYSTVQREDGNTFYLADHVALGKDGQGSTQHAERPDPEKDRLIDRIMVKQMLGSLQEKERKLIYMRYFQNMTQTQIANQMGISQVQVSRLEKKILLHLRNVILQ